MKNKSRSSAKIRANFLKNSKNVFNVLNLNSTKTPSYHAHNRNHNPIK